MDPSGLPVGHCHDEIVGLSGRGTVPEERSGREFVSCPLGIYSTHPRRSTHTTPLTDSGKWVKGALPAIQK